MTAPRPSPRFWPAVVYAASSVLQFPVALGVFWAWSRLGGLDWALEGNSGPLETLFDVASTPVVRTIIGLTTLATIGTWLVLTRRWSGLQGVVSTVPVAASVFTAGLSLTGQSIWPALALTMLVVINMLPAHFIAKGAGRMSTTVTVLSLVPAICVFCVGLTHPWMVTKEQALRMSPRATIVARDDMNWIQRDRTGRYLFATGAGLDRIHRYDLEHLSAAPVESGTDTGGAQSFALDLTNDELHAYNSKTRRLISLDASSLALKRASPLPDLSPGDSWTISDSTTDTILVASENNDHQGTPFLLVDRTSGEVRDRRQEDAGNLLKNPGRPVVYLGFFRRAQVLKAYDLVKRAVVSTTPTESHLSRMAFWPGANEVLVSSPSRSRILRFDADTLAPKGHFTAPFGARGLAVDSTHNLLFCASLATGRLSIVSLTDARVLASTYLGPWLRSVVLDTERRRAYVSSKFGLYSYDYQGAF